MTMPTWISEFQAFAAVGIASGVAFIGVQQFRISSRKLKLDLYEKRYRIYDAMRLYLVTTFQETPNTEQHTLDAYAKKAEARFLLDTKACEYIEEFVTTVTNYQNVRKFTLDRNFDSMLPKDRMQFEQEQHRKMTWILAQYEPLSAEFDRFLNLDHALAIKPPTWAALSWGHVTQSARNIVATLRPALTMPLPRSDQTVHLMNWFDVLRVRRAMRRESGRNTLELELYTTDDLRRLYQSTNDNLVRLRDGIVSRAELVAEIRWRVLWAHLGYRLLLAVSLVGMIAAVAAAWEGRKTF